MEAGAGYRPDRRYPWSVAIVSMIKQGWSFAELENLTDAQFWLMERTHIHLSRLARQAEKDAKNKVTRKPM